MEKYPSPADIAEMKARGADRETLAEALRRSERWSAAEQLCRDIEKAFDGVTLGKGVGLTEAQGLDDYADAETCAAYRANDEKEDWRRIPAEALNRCNSSLSFFDAEGMRFHLPAYLIAELRGDYEFGIDYCLTYLSDHTISKFTLLSLEQRKVIRDFLRFIADDPEYSSDLPHIKRALETYWAEPN